MEQTQNSSLAQIKQSIEKFGAYVIQDIRGLGDFTLFILKFFFWCFRPPFRHKLLFEQLYFIGNKSIFIVSLTGAFTGMVMAYQMYYGSKLISMDTFVGPIVAMSLARELSPVLTGLIVAGRAGAAMAAAIGTMKVTEQIDALEVMGVDSHQYLAAPRIVACTLAMPLLTIFHNFIGNVGSYVIGTKVLGISEVVYFANLSQLMLVEDIFQGVIKAFFFGFFISWIGTYHGFSVTGGADGVGRGTNLAVVWGMITVLVADFFLTSFLVQIL